MPISLGNISNGINGSSDIENFVKLNKNNISANVIDISAITTSIATLNDVKQNNIILGANISYDATELTTINVDLSTKQDAFTLGTSLSLDTGNALNVDFDDVDNDTKINSLINVALNFSLRCNYPLEKLGTTEFLNLKYNSSHFELNTANELQLKASQSEIRLFNFTFTTLEHNGARVNRMIGPLNETYPTSIKTTLGSISIGKDDASVRVGGFNLYQGYQKWTINTSGLYNLVAGGAESDNNLNGETAPLPGKGIVINTSINLQKDDIIIILVGQYGGSYTDETSQAGGGGTFVVKYNGTGNINLESSWTPILIAGGGGSRTGANTLYNRINGWDGVINASGTSSDGQVPGTQSSYVGAGGINGDGGNMGTNGDKSYLYGGSSGAGFSGNGLPFQGSTGTGGTQIERTPYSFINNGKGGFNVLPTGGGGGGFGGGGGSFNGGGGGGGYCGGGGGPRNVGYASGGGGGSYDINGLFNNATLYNVWDVSTFGTAPSTFNNGYNTGNGYVYISAFLEQEYANWSDNETHIFSSLPINVNGAINSTVGYKINDINLQYSDIENTPFTMLTNGDVGIGTNSPSAKFDIWGNICFYNQNINNDFNQGVVWGSGYHIKKTAGAWSGNYQQLELKWVTGITFRTGYAYGKSFVGVDNGMSIGSSYYATKPPNNSLLVQDKIGINKTNPTYRLDVNGISRIDNCLIGYWQDANFTSIRHHSLSSVNSYALMQHSGGKTYLNCASGKEISFRVDNSTKMTLTSGGFLGIGKSPVTALDVNGSINATGTIYTTYMNVGQWDIYEQGTNAGWISDGDLVFNHSGGSYDQGLMWLQWDDTGADSLDFTGSHRSVTKNKALYNSNYIGYIVSSTGNYKDLNSKYKGNKQNIKINSALPYVELTNNSYCPRVYGVISDKEDENNTRRSYAVGGFNSGYKKDKGDHRLVLNAVGEGSLYVSDYNGPISNGDYVCSSLIPGICMKQDDDILHNYTIAKVTMNCDFNPKYEALLILKEELIYTSNINVSNVTVTSNLENVLDSNGDLIYVEQRDENSNVIYDYEYEMKYIKLDGSIIQKDMYNSNVDYRIAFVGCIYLCG